MPFKNSKFQEEEIKISGYPRSDLISVSPLTEYTVSAWEKPKTQMAQITGHKKQYDFMKARTKSVISKLLRMLFGQNFRWCGLEKIHNRFYPNLYIVWCNYFDNNNNDGYNYNNNTDLNSRHLGTQVNNGHEKQ